MNEVILTPIEQKPLSFTLPVLAAAGAFAGLFVGAANGSSLLGILGGAIVMAAIGFLVVNLIGEGGEKAARWGMIAVFALVGFLLGAVPGLVVGALFGWFFGWFSGFDVSFSAFSHILLPQNRQ